MNGPPGTGKSQTIANIIAEALANGKRVLFISEKIAALDVVHKRLAQRGIAEFCLKLHGRDAARREVVESLHESLTSKTKPHLLMPERELEKLAALRRRLTATVQTLHTRSPLLADRSPRDVFARISELAEDDPVTGAPKATASSKKDHAAELSTLLELFRAASEHWALATDPEFAWRDYDASSFGPEERSELVSVIDRLVGSALGMADTAIALAERLGVSPSESERDARHLLALTSHLNAAPSVDIRWLDDGGLEGAEAAAYAAKEAHRTYEAAEEVFRQRYPHRDPADFDPRISERFESAIRSLDGLLGRASTWDDRLVPFLGELRQFSQEASELLTRLGDRTAEVGTALGQSSAELGIADAERIAALAELSFRATRRPDRRWLIPAGQQAAHGALDAIAPVAGEYTAAAEGFGSRYRSSLIEEDLASLEARLEAAEGRRLAKLSGSYRADIRLLKEARVDGRTPSDPLEDVREARRLVNVGERFDAVLREYESALGAWYSGRSTDVAGAKQALEVAGTAAELIQPDTDLECLAAEMCVGATGSPTVAQGAATIRELLGDLKKGIGLLDSLSGSVNAISRIEAPFRATSAEVDRLREPIDTLATVVEELRDGRAEPPASLPEIAEDSQAISSMAAATTLMNEASPLWADALGAPYRGPDTPWDELNEALIWTRELRELLAGVDVPDEIRSLLGSNRHIDLLDLSHAIDRYAESHGELCQRFVPRRRKQLIDLATSSPVETFLAEVNSLSSSIDRLGEWTDFYRAQAGIKDRNWVRFLQNLISGGVPADRVEPEAERAYWSARLELYFAQHPEMKDFRGRSHEKVIAQFAELDLAMLRAATDRIIQACNERRPSPVAMAGSEVGILMREAKKKKRHLPVRKLLHALPNTLPNLKPCLMMSPLTVSHYLSPDHHFDLIVFDEASQVPPWDAINCIYRGDQLVVAGDSKQLPPTPFFQLTDPEDSEADENVEMNEEVMESILDSCSTVLPGDSLRWHYRSRHEHLIAFSNHHFYNNGLVTFPAPTTETPELGVHFFHVPEGVYDRARSRSNRAEAKQVADRVWEHLRSRPGRSLGVVTFSVAQRDAIDDELNTLRQLHPELEDHFTENRLDGVFVKNLESVQGDERDVILFSMGYGKDEHGNFHMGFGPLNRDGGHRRLNVAVTRAREQVDVFASVRAGDFNLAETAAPGARYLQSYLEFAERGPEALRSEVESMGGDYESPFEEEVAKAISDLGYQAIPQVGVSGFRIDLGVLDPRAPGRFVLGIECDGATYHSTPTARDRDRLRQQVLEGLGWRIHRIWSWDWVRERHREVARLQNAIKAAIQDGEVLGSPDGADGSAEEIDEGEFPVEPERTRESIEVNEVRSPEEALALPWVTAYKRVSLEGFSSHYEFHEPANRPVLGEALIALVTAETPVHDDYAIKRLAEAQGIVRRGPRIVAACRAVMKLAIDRGQIESRGDFLWSPEQEVLQVRVPNASGARREIREIPPEEIELAISHLAVSSGAYDLDSLLRQVARLFGFERSGATIQSELRGRLNAIISRTESRE